jgi:putative transcriptional regulator
MSFLRIFCWDDVSKVWVKRYFVEFGLAMLAYTIVLPASIIAVQRWDLGIWRAPVGLSPVVPLALAVWAYAHAVYRMDEFTRHIHTKSIVFAAAVTLIASTAISFFGNAGLPRFNFYVWHLGSRALLQQFQIPLSMENRLKALRTERNWSQQDLGLRLGVSRQTIIAIEKGKYDPSLPLAFAISQLFGCRIEDVFIPRS